MVFSHLIVFVAIFVTAFSSRRFHGYLCYNKTQGDIQLGEPLTEIDDDLKRSYDVSMTFLEDKVWDVIVVTDDYGLYDEMANTEDKLVMDELKKLGRNVTRASFMDHSFDWHAGRVIVIRTAWAKVRVGKNREIL